MDIFERLNALDTAITQTFQPAFIFLVHPDKVQHFPAREWTNAQVRDALQQHLGMDYTLDLWKGQLIAIAKNQQCIAILPKYASIASLSED
ncbi:hypothetical protein ACYSNO_11070 [Enterococcus sp. LJL98]